MVVTWNGTLSRPDSGDQTKGQLVEGQRSGLSSCALVESISQCESSESPGCAGISLPTGMIYRPMDPRVARHSDPTEELWSAVP